MKNKSIAESSEISLRIERYEDIFSDFDIRPYARRSLSVDFLEELKRASYDKENNGIEIDFWVPAHIHNQSIEVIIRERLQEHFRKHFNLLLKEKKQIINQGIKMVILGIMFMLMASYIIFRDPAENLLLSFLVVFLEPAAWFLLWEGMDIIIFTPKNINHQLEFYKKMSHSRSDIHFRVIE